jgi:glycosyltransferase involved in cell wall biosynthesis
MRILMTTYEFPPVGGGGGQVAAGLAQRLTAFGDEVDVVTMGYAGLSNVESSPRLNIYRVPSIRRDLRRCNALEAASYVLVALPAVSRLTRRRRYDLVHSHFVLPDGLLGAYASRSAQVPLIITAHGTDVPSHNPSRVRLLHTLVHPVWRVVTSRASLIVCPSESLRLRVEGANRRARTTVIPNGSDPGRFDPVKPKAKRVLAVSRMVPSKGMQYLLQALSGFRADYEVVLVGDGPYRADLQRLATDLSIPVRFVGWLDNDSERLKYLYETSSIFVFPSEVENCPLALLDAMAAGTAIVTTKNSGCDDVVMDTAILVPPREPIAIRDALEELASQEALADRLRAAARARLESCFSWDLVVDRYREVFRSHARAS